jgi:hypothetical protein
MMGTLLICISKMAIFNVGTPSLEARNIRLVNIITYIIEESKLISENMSPNRQMSFIVSKMATSGHLQFSYDLYHRRYHS